MAIRSSFCSVCIYLKLQIYPVLFMYSIVQWFFLQKWDLQSLGAKFTLYIDQKKSMLCTAPWGCAAEQLRLLAGLRVMTWLTGIGDSPHTSWWKWVSRVAAWLMATLSAAATVFSAEVGSVLREPAGRMLNIFTAAHRQYGVKRKCICLNAYFAAWKRYSIDLRRLVRVIERV